MQKIQAFLRMFMLHINKWYSIYSSGAHSLCLFLTSISYDLRRCAVCPGLADFQVNAYTRDFFFYSENDYGWNFPCSEALIMQAALIPYYPMGSMYTVRGEKKKYILNWNQISVLQ